MMCVQVRGGTGGEEAALFALDLFRMYQRFAALKGWRWEQLALDITEVVFPPLCSVELAPPCMRYLRTYYYAMFS